MNTTRFHLFALIIITFLFGSNTYAANWTATIALTPAQVRYAQDTHAEITSTFAAKGITATIVNGKLAFSGTQGIQQLNNTLFVDSAKWANFFAGPVELTLDMPANSQPVTLRLETMLTAGYIWEWLSPETALYVQQDKATFAMRYPGLGAPAIQTIRLSPKNSGGGKIRLIHWRIFEKYMPIHTTINLQVTATNNPIELIDTQPHAPTNVPDMKTGKPAQLPSKAQLSSLPSSYDSSALGLVPAVRDQGYCGSCWAFSTVGAMEVAVAKSCNGRITDLAEQFLVSCNNDGWSCNGGWMPHKYHTDTLANRQSSIGAVLESDDQYTATNGYCGVYNHPYRASSYSGISSDTQSIKSAIYQYGAVSTTVCADSAFGAYTGGVFTNQSCASVGINHAVTLVGWDDANQSWIMRNSWGSWWGENGYMRIQYDPTGVKSKIGQYTSWISYSSTACPNFITTVTVTPSAGANGSISPSTAQTINKGATISFTATPNTNYTNGTVGGTCPQGSWNGNVWTTGAITDNCTVDFSFTISAQLKAALTVINSILFDNEQFTVTPSITGSGGSITPNIAQVVEEGSTIAFTATPNTGYAKNDLVGGTCPQGKWNGNVWTTGAIVGNCTVIFSFFSATLSNHTVTPSAGTGGTVSPNTAQMVIHGAAKAFTVTPNTNYATVQTVGGTCPQGSWSGNVWTTGAIIANCTVNFSFLSTAKPDFVVTGISLSTATPTINGTFNATITVKNQGTVAANGAYLDVWPQQPNAQTCGATGDSWQAVGTLTAGASKTFTFTRLPAGIAGSKMFRAYVDSGCATAETNESNNQNTVIYTVNAPTSAIDLVITGVSLNPAAPAASGTFNATITVKNQGTTVAGNGAYLDIWPHQPTVQTCKATGGKRQVVGSLTASTNQTITLTGLQAGGIAGSKMLRAFVDSECSTDEKNEANNQSTVLYSVNAPTSTVDFVITGITLSTTPAVNGTFTATVTVKNQGTSAGDGKFLDVWSNQPAGQVCGTAGNKRQSVGSLAAGTSKTLTFTGLSAGSAGSKMLRAFVNSGCGMGENNEGNNQLTKAYTVQ